MRTAAALALHAFLQLSMWAAHTPFWGDPSWFRDTRTTALAALFVGSGVIWLAARHVAAGYERRVARAATWGAWLVLACVGAAFAAVPFLLGQDLATPHGGTKFVYVLQPWLDRGFSLLLPFVIAAWLSRASASTRGERLALIAPYLAWIALCACAQFLPAPTFAG